MPPKARFLKTFLQHRFPSLGGKGTGRHKQDPSALPVLLPSRSVLGSCFLFFGPFCCLPAPCLFFGFWFFASGGEREGEQITPPGALPVLLPYRSLSGQVAYKASLGKIPCDMLAQMIASADFLNTLGSNGFRGHLSLRQVFKKRVAVQFPCGVNFKMPPKPVSLRHSFNIHSTQSPFP